MSKKEEVFGLHSVAAILEHAPTRVLELFVQKEKTQDTVQPVVDLAKKAGIRPQFCLKKTLDQRADGGNHQGVLVVVQPAPQLTESALPDLVDNAAGAPLFLVLDQVTDPHNLGACLRTADAAGVTAVIVPKDKSAALNSTVRKVASGAAEIVPFVVVTNLARALKDLQQLGVWIYGTAGEATTSVYQHDYKGPVAFVMGAEGTGMRRLTREHCDELISIPLQGTVSSLNVSVATGVTLFEAVRQRSSM
ncbi:MULTISPECIES: 23S rRNA (guanosine(2251)-2'-O)-methyltransferase RlmB [Gammaproteobacteria]|uniref:23S rRNA (guanosine(2251)-2'-O)-methyltransferase RlmB n=1 Tax=Gammaproteobacteria TaxID=1236 RepID=UPI000DD036FC|nr:MULTISPECIES: 23S rRNA (guanosine(2251)-2'-O)-methyltransferase RlmB [Gammaproteobacteria]RTE87669.1 23S rRNA (guanosine(2251)-2'-O)-methyltransferase RlmB [Aliidiomarina sp. B3213]TCZ92547.1 23S rRNA (guanosine(2251)-2'-O)-methyltransferase RlmB [Lysobacter sp. N42]